MTAATQQQQTLALAQGFASRIQRWSLASGASSDAANAAACASSALSLATSSGHVCIRLADLPALPAGPGDVDAWRAALNASGVVGLAAAPGAYPLVLDAADRLYLHRYADYERRLAQRLLCAQGVASTLDAVQTGRARARLEQLFATPAHASTAAPNWQKLAVALALHSRLLVISGGPGTGKTSTLVRLLGCLLELEPQCRMALAAPTGKAAARMTEAIRQQSAILPESLRAGLPQESFTVHRLLGSSPQDGGWTYHAGNPLPIDLLVVDEASMLDLALATHLLEAVAPTARIILLGDKDQLAAVESGSVFAELSADPTLTPDCIEVLAALTAIPAAAITPPAPTHPSGLRNAAVWFSHSYRFAADSAIGRAASLINTADVNGLLALLHDPQQSELAWIREDAVGAETAATSSASLSSPPVESRILHCMEQAYAPMLRAVRDDLDVSAVMQMFSQFRVLCALRETSRGVLALNAEFSRRWVAALGGDPRSATPQWFPGRPVQILRNDYAMQLFNGDIGVALPDAQGETCVYFAQADGSFRGIPPVRLPAHETAFAMTVHKSQGSEFDAVLVVLPEQRSRITTRELLYTGLTRARRHVTLCASAAVIGAVLRSATQRDSGLLDRLRQ